ncbi:MAG TPA: beta-ketoacyl-[acyl-carrier-protein] synthase family protein [Polyangiaceae bacterium]|nr:beta-ketoacyl-[acyl-carrier-protein] synthase family protein [Polyangiaceae bacterium]
MQRRVVITGCGVVTAAGNELGAFWKTLMDGASCIRPLTSFAYAEMGQLSGAEVQLPAEDRLSPDVDPDPVRARCLELGLAAARRAWTGAGFDAAGPDRERTGVSFGTTMGEERQVGHLSETRKADADVGVDAGFFTRANNHRLAAEVASRFGCAGPVLMTTTACSSGNAAAAHAFDAIASGDADVMLTGGADVLTRLIYCGFQRMGVLSASVCRPFDKSRDGVSFGEGAAAVVLESLEHAQARGARILAELAGYGMSNDAHHITAPGPHGEGFVRAVHQALAQSGLGLDRVSYVSAHGTGTPYNDKGESEAMVTLFGARAKQVPISSIKSIIGHTNGAASAIETVACVLALQHGAVPPTAGWREPDPEFDLDYVPGKGKSHSVDVCLNLAAGFGGHNVCLVLRRFA